MHSSEWGGQKGAPLRVVTNSFEVTRLPVKPFYQYHDIQPEVKAARRRTEIIERLQVTHAHIFTPRPMFDGQMIIYISKLIDGTSFDVNMSDRPPPPGGKPKGVYRINLTYASTINPTDANRLISNREDSPVTKVATNLLQMLIRQAPSLLHTRKGRSYFSDADKIVLAGGIEVWRGFFQSVRPSLGKMLVNIDVSVAAMYGRGKLLDHCLHVIGGRDVSQLRLRQRDASYLELKRSLRNLFITVDTDPAPQEKKRRRKIRDLVDMAGHYRFDKTDAAGHSTPMTVAQYFEVTYRRKIEFPDVIGVQLGTPDKPNVIPAELCYIPPGQVYKHKLPEKLVDEARSFATKKPRERLNIIQNGVISKSGKQLVAPPALVYQQSDFLADAGMTIASQPLGISGRVLNPPDIFFARESRVTPKSGAWQTLGNQFQEPVAIERWAVLNLSTRIRDPDAQEFVRVLVHSCNRLGIKIQMLPESNYRRATDATSVLRSLRPGEVSLVVVLLPERAKELRAQVKQWGDVFTGVMTQCLKESKLMKAISDWRQRQSDQYTNNVAMKINAKLGGTNSILMSDAMRYLSQAPYMICGADVSHPPPTSMTRPSVASLVWSHDPWATKYAAYARVQAPHEEIIEDLGGMMHEALFQFGVKNNKQLPKRIIIFRDGVSEGEYSKVAEVEIKQIEDAIIAVCKRVGMPPSAPLPVVTFIVVGKRHHVRFFPANEREADRSGNCPAGFVADRGLTSPIAADFYLQSHAGILGTSRPAHYIVLKDDNFNFNADKLQELAWNLCHVYAKANRSVSIPAPVYYADIVCARAEFYFDPELRFEEDTTSSGRGAGAGSSAGGKPKFDLQKWRDGFGDREGRGRGLGPFRVWHKMFFV